MRTDVIGTFLKLFWLALALSGCSLQAQLASLYQPSDVWLADNQTVANLNDNGEYMVSGGCEDGITYFQILSPEPQQTVQCKGGTWSATLDLTQKPDGEVKLLTDLKDFKTGKPVVLVVRKDTAPPVISSITLESGANFTNKTNISYVATGLDLEDLYVTADNTCSTGGSWQGLSGHTNIVVGDGLKNLYAKGRDAVGNISDCILVSSITLDQTPPVVTGLSDDTIVTALKSWSWSCVDANPGCEVRHQISSAVALAPVGIFGLTMTASQSGDGLYFVNVQAKDQAGNLSALVSVQATLSSSLPSLEIENGAVYHGSSLANLNPLNSGSFDEVEVSNTVGCASPTAYPTSSTVAWTLLPGQGVRTIFYRFKDTVAGVQTACYQASITVDTAAPSVSLSSAVGAVFNSSSFSVSALFSEDVTGFSAADVNVVNGSVSAVTGSASAYSFVVTPAGQGLVSVNILAASVQDVAGNGNTASAVLSRTYDTVVPVATLSYSGGSVISSAITVALDFSESITGFTLTDLNVTNGSVTGLSGSGASYTFTLTPTSQGQVIVELPTTQVVDAAGNPNTALTSLTLDFDSLAPSVTGLSNDLTWAKTKTWNWGCSETCDYRFVVDTNASTTPSGAFSNTVTASQLTGSGSYYLHVQARDEAGNLSTVTHVQARLDNTLPVAATSVVDQVTKSSLTTSPVITFVAGSDAHSGVNRYEARVLRTSDSAEMATWAPFVSGNILSGLSLVTNTSYKIQIQVVDEAGNTSAVAASDGWIADTTAPSAPTALALGAVPTSLTATPALSWTASSDGAGGSGVQYYEVRIFRSSDNAVMSAWTGLASGGSVSGLTLAEGGIYYYKVRAVDAANNVGAESTSGTWTANSDPCALPTPPAGSSCASGTVYIGIIGATKYMTTPSGCSDIPANPGSATTSAVDFVATCDGVSSDIRKYWNNGTATTVDTSLPNYAGTSGIGNGGINTDANSGSHNTPTLVASGVLHPAAAYCEKLSYGGYTDWFLPNRAELNLLYVNRYNLNGVLLVNTGQAHWSSTEGNKDSAWSQWFSDGYQTNDIKSVSLQVRCMRKF